MAWDSSAQFSKKYTAGINEVVAIEKIAAERKAYQRQIQLLTASLDSVSRLKVSKIQRAQEELDAMKKARDMEIIDLKMGYFCSKCHVLKSVMEARGENFEKHLKDVSGHPIPASDGEIASVRSVWVEKIAMNTVALNGLKTDDSKDEIYYKDKIVQTKKILEDFCKKVQELEEIYTLKVFNEHKEIITKEVNKAMRVAASEMIFWNNYVLNQFWVDSIRQAKIDSFQNSVLVVNLDRLMTTYKQKQFSYEQKALKLMKQFDLSRDSVKTNDARYYNIMLSEINRMDLARNGWCGQSSRGKLLSLDNNFNTLTECMYFIQHQHSLVKTDCTINWIGFKEVYVPFIQSLPSYQITILLNDKNKYINKVWLSQKTL